MANTADELTQLIASLGLRTAERPETNVYQLYSGVTIRFPDRSECRKAGPLGKENSKKFMIKFGYRLHYEDRGRQDQTELRKRSAPAP